MTVQLHNTLTGVVEDFVSQEPNYVKLYTCGPTVYDYLHVGNWFGYIVWDVLVRVLQANDYTVDRVMNITDVGHLVSDADDGQDKLEKGAKREGKTAWEVATFYGDDFLASIPRLGLIAPTHITKATDFIPQQLELVRTLKQKGFTYQIDDGIYFDVSKFPTYADFAHLDLAALQAGARVEFNPEKRNHSDFALWKFTPAGEKRDMEWATPEELLEDGIRQMEYGEQAVTDANSQSPIANRQIMGFPGWHLECSAMAMSLLGHTLDIHTGGIDHIPVHHTNEIAQSEAATGSVFSHFWLHNNHLKVDGTKISKSLENGYTLDDLEQKGFSPLDYRMFVLQTHYRTEGNFTFDNLTAAKNRLRNWRNIAALRHQTHDTINDDDDKANDDGSLSLYATSQAVIEALNNDLGTPTALAIIDDAFSKLTNRKLDDIHQHGLISLLETIDDLLGLQLLTTTPDINDDMKRIIIERRSVRAHQDWNASDRLRDEIAKNGIMIRDTATETVWEYNS
jgi:cysteinyl-tRNA synthetase